MTAESTMKTTHLNFFYFLLRIYMDIYMHICIRCARKLMTAESTMNIYMYIYI